MDVHQQARFSGTKLARIRPCANRSTSHVASFDVGLAAGHVLYVRRVRQDQLEIADCIELGGGLDRLVQVEALAVGGDRLKGAGGIEAIERLPQRFGKLEAGQLIEPVGQGRRDRR